METGEKQRRVPTSRGKGHEVRWSRRKIMAKAYFLWGNGVGKETFGKNEEGGRRAKREKKKGRIER